MPEPLRADVKLGFACNNHCLFCAQGHKREACGAIAVDEIVRRLGDVRRTARALVLTGGEPTLHRHILDIAAAARRLGFRPIQLQTNGRMLAYPAAVRALAAAGITEVSPSLHGSTPAIHDGLTAAPGSFAQSLAGIRNALDAGLPVITNSVITRPNVADLPSLVELLAGLGVRHAQLAFVHPVGTAAERFDEVVPRLGDLVAPLAAARAVARARGVSLVTEAVPLCFLREMTDLAVEDRIPPTTVVELDGGAFDYSGWRVAEGKAHGPPCTACAVRARCEGPWREYPARFGWDEFIAIAPGEAAGSA